MIHTIDRASEAEGAVLRAMFEARKRVFVDLLKWDVPVLGGSWELDQFDDHEATYLVLADSEAGHLASARLLKTTRPHILDTLFTGLVDGERPQGPDIVEITRFCLERGLRASERRQARNGLVGALAQHALEHGIARYVGVAEMGWYRQIAAFGWRCAQLGKARLVGGVMLTAMVIDVDASTPDLLAANGIGAPRGRATTLLRPVPAAEVRA
jgi:acyl-homoserine lactone synthase